MTKRIVLNLTLLVPAGMLLFMMLLFAGTPAPATAQDRLPVREFTPHDAIVVLDRGLAMNDAVRILSEFSVRHENRMILNLSSFTGNIALGIPGLHWRDALDLVTGYHQLVVETLPDRIEIRDRMLPQQVAAQERRGGPARQIFSDTREIEISATFFQGDRRFLREIGVNWSAIRNGMVEVSSFGAGSVSEPQFALGLNISEMTGTGQWQIDALLNTLEAINKGEILSSPTIKVLEGEVGRIQVGQDFSIKQRDFAGNVIDQFFSTGTILTVTPWLIPSDGEPFIFMEVLAERSSAQPDAVSTIINKQEATTKILLVNGETTAIAGLYETEQSTVRRGVPLLKDLPPWFFGLRYLFGFESVQYSQRELIIVIQARLVPAIEDRIINESMSRMELIRRESEQLRRQNHPPSE